MMGLQNIFYPFMVFMIYLLDIELCSTFMKDLGSFNELPTCKNTSSCIHIYFRALRKDITIQYQFETDGWKYVKCQTCVNVNNFKIVIIIMIIIFIHVKSIVSSENNCQKMLAASCFQKKDCNYMHLQYHYFIFLNKIVLHCFVVPWKKKHIAQSM